MFLHTTDKRLALRKTEVVGTKRESQPSIRNGLTLDLKMNSFQCIETLADKAAAGV